MEHRKAICAVLAVFEAGSLNSEQLKAIQRVRVLIGDAEEQLCPHESTAYEEGDALICQDCRAVLSRSTAPEPPVIASEPPKPKRSAPRKPAAPRPRVKPEKR